MLISAGQTPKRNNQDPWPQMVRKLRSVIEGRINSFETSSFPIVFLGVRADWVDIHRLPRMHKNASVCFPACLFYVVICAFFGVV